MIIMALLLIAGASAFQPASPAVPPAAVEARVQGLLKAMSNAEKARQLDMYSGRDFLSNGRCNPPLEHSPSCARSRFRLRASGPPGPPGLCTPTRPTLPRHADSLSCARPISCHGPGPLHAAAGLEARRS